MKELLIEKWFPVLEASVESGRERAGANMLPPLYFLGLWWARRPQSAARIASILATLPQENLSKEEKKRLLWAIGLRGDPTAALENIAKGNPTSFGYPTLEGTEPEPKVYIERMVKSWGRKPVGADFMAGGGCIPFEMLRSGFGEIAATEYNPVAYIILKASLEYPIRYGERLVADVRRYGEQVLAALKRSMGRYFPNHPFGQPIDYIWVRMFKCPECGVETPSLKSLWLDRDDGYALYPTVKNDSIELNVVKVEEIEDGPKFKVVEGKFAGKVLDSGGYEKDGELECPKHRHTLSKKTVKEQYRKYLNSKEQDSYHGSQPTKLVAVYLDGKKYVEPTPEMINAYSLAEKDLREAWTRLVSEDLLPLEVHNKGEADRVVAYGLDTFVRMFNARQLLAHAEIMRLIKESYVTVAEDEVRKGSSKEEAAQYSKAIATYLTLVLGKILNYNSTLTSWKGGAIRSTFDTHAFAWTWDFAEGDMVCEKKGLFEWALKNVLKALRGIVKRTKNQDSVTRVILGDAGSQAEIGSPPGGYDLIFIDPPYYGNVQYGEISDYFYVWFRKTLHNLYPEAFMTPEVPKQEEAVANRVRHGSAKLASTHYETKMHEIFMNARKALRDDGVFLLWFAHKTGAAWTKTVHALLDSGFAITALWGVRSEMARSFHISGKAALRTSIIMTCRKQQNSGGYIQDALQALNNTLGLRLQELEDQGLVGPDFLMGAQAIALKVSSTHWPIRDPSGETTPEQALDVLLDHATGAAVNHITRKVAPEIVGIDAPTKFYILTKLLYSDEIPYDDARRLALACLGASGIGDPVQELVDKVGLGKLAATQVSGERTKMVTLSAPWDRARNGQLFKSDPAPTIDYVHAAISSLEEGKPITNAAVQIAKGGPLICDVLKALYHILPDETPTGRRTTTRNREKIHVQTLLLTVCQEGLHLIVQNQLKEKEIQRHLEDFSREVKL
jgi:putative DNA methylase